MVERNCLVIFYCYSVLFGLCLLFEVLGVGIMFRLLVFCFLCCLVLDDSSHTLCKV